MAILANSRPYEGLVLAIPALLLLILDASRRRNLWTAASITRVISSIFGLVLLTAAAMAFYNFRVTGDALRMPYQIHEETYAIAPLFIWQTPPPEPNYRHAIIRDYHRVFALGQYTEHQSIAGLIIKLVKVAAVHLRSAHVLLIPVIGVFPFLVSWARRNRWGRLSALISFTVFLGIFLETFTGAHYAAPIVGLYYFIAMIALRFWVRHNQKVGNVMLWFIPLLSVGLMAISLRGTAQQERQIPSKLQRARVLDQLKQAAGKQLVVVSYGPRHSYHREWVYNESAIDAAKVVWARWINPEQNCKLLNYFKKRRVWLLEVNDDQAPPNLAGFPSETCPPLQPP